MIDEGSFQAALDADPTDSVTRLVFADWLDEEGDPRGPGYRMMGARGLYPYFPRVKEGGWGWYREIYRYAPDSSVPPHAVVPDGIRDQMYNNYYAGSRRAAEDNLAKAWAASLASAGR